jgi:outer membrane protein
MKQILFVTILLIASICSNAQPVAGKLFVGGSLGLRLDTEKTKEGSTTVKEPSITEITILPQAGYFLSDRIAVGAFLGVESIKTNYHDAGTIDKSTSTVFHIEPYGRYYLISGKAGLFAEAGITLGIGKDKSKYEAVSVETDKFQFALGLAPGVYLYITEKFCLESKFGWVGFETQTEKHGDTKNTSNTIGLNIHPDFILFGLTYML